MKKLVMCFLLVTVFCLSSSCAFAEAFMKKALNSWIGYSINDVINSWGYPNEEKNIANKHLFYWYTNSTIYVPPSTTSTLTPNLYNSTITTTTSGGYTVNSSCNKIIEVNKENKVVAWQYNGNSCPSFYFTGKKLVNPQNDEWLIKKKLKNKNKI